MSRLYTVWRNVKEELYLFLLILNVKEI
jgi:hypothetical protein